MIKITRAYVGYKVTFSPQVKGWRGFSVTAQDTDELHLAIEHWFEGHGGHNPEGCPVCAHVLRNNKRRATD